MRSARRALWFGAKVAHLGARAGALVAAALAAGCEEPRKAAPPRPVEEAPILVGVQPANFRCDSLITAEAMSELLGQPARQVESAAASPNGVASPCNYLVTVPGQPSPAWTFDIDCRDNMKQKADALFAQYERTSAELVAAAMTDSAASAPSPVDGGAAKPRKKPELAREVDVGARGLDHHGSGLLFLDDDAPCYVRVVGPDADKRLALAKHLATALTPATAPMSPRPLRSVMPR